jgi:phospholipid transport system transporter-binding protein
MADARQRVPELRVVGDTLHLSGELGLDTVAGVLAGGRAAIDARAGGHAALDLSGVSRSDSAGVALVVDWLRAARRHRVTFEVRAIPAQMNDIARVSGLAELLAGKPQHAA